MKKVEQQCQDFLQSRQSLLLSTQAVSGELETSVVPFVQLNEGEFAIFVSELAQHTQNLLVLEKLPKSNSTGLVAGLLLADESETEQMFARERLSMQLSVERITEEPLRSDTISNMQNQFGEVVEVLRGLPDFHCFKLKVVSGRYVRGFGAAYEFAACPCQGLQGIKGR
ncbi:MAG: HugZ family protein [Pseudomonadota bacterium]|nr:HugZ family protein [Pseudomonadota bacterium]